MKKILAMVLTGIFLILSATTCMAEDYDWAYEDDAEYYCYEDDYDDCDEYCEYDDYDEYCEYDDYDEYCEYDDYDEYCEYDDYDEYCEYDDYDDYDEYCEYVDYEDDCYEDCYDCDYYSDYESYDSCDVNDDYDEYVAYEEDDIDISIESEDSSGSRLYLGNMRVQTTNDYVPMFNTNQAYAQILCYVPADALVQDCILIEDNWVICSYYDYAGYVSFDCLTNDYSGDCDETETYVEEEKTASDTFQETQETIATNEQSQHSQTSTQDAEHSWLKIGGVNGCWRCEGCGGVFLTNTGWQLHSLSTPYWSPCHYFAAVYWQWWD